MGGLDSTPVRGALYELGIKRLDSLATVKRPAQYDPRAKIESKGRDPNHGSAFLQGDFPLLYPTITLSL